MKFLVFISDFIIPLMIFYIVGHGILMKKNVYDDFVKGAKDGFKTVIRIMPTLIGLMVAVGILRASGFLDMIADVLGRFTNVIHLPSQLVPLIIVRMFSSSAAARKYRNVRSSIQRMLLPAFYHGIIFPRLRQPICVSGLRGFFSSAAMDLTKHDILY